MVKSYDTNNLRLSKIDFFDKKDSIANKEINTNELKL